VAQGGLDPLRASRHRPKGCLQVSHLPANAVVHIDRYEGADLIRQS
jgi:hypothetical protein